MAWLVCDDKQHTNTREHAHTIAENGIVLVIFVCAKSLFLRRAHAAAHPYFSVIRSFQIIYNPCVCACGLTAVERFAVVVCLCVCVFMCSIVVDWVVFKKRQKQTHPKRMRTNAHRSCMRCMGGDYGRTGRSLASSFPWLRQFRLQSSGMYGNCVPSCPCQRIPRTEPPARTNQSSEMTSVANFVPCAGGREFARQ